MNKFTHLSFANSQFTFISHLPFTEKAGIGVWKMIPGKLLENGKWKMENSSVGGVRG